MSEDTFGLSDEAKFFITKTAEATADATVAKAFESRLCPRDCEALERVDKKAEQVHRWAFGRSEEKLRGTNKRLEDVEKFVAGLNRLKWLVIAAIVSGVGSTIVGLVMLAASLAAKG